MRGMQQQRGNLGTISAFACRHRETKNNLTKKNLNQEKPETHRSHTTTRHSRQDSFGRVNSSSQRPLPNNTQHSQQTSMPRVGFEPTIAAGERPQIYALDRAATGTGMSLGTVCCIYNRNDLLTKYVTPSGYSRFNSTNRLTNRHRIFYSTSLHGNFDISDKNRHTN